MQYIKKLVVIILIASLTGCGSFNDSSGGDAYFTSSFLLEGCYSIAIFDAFEYPGFFGGTTTISFFYIWLDQQGGNDILQSNGFVEIEGAVSRMSIDGFMVAPPISDDVDGKMLPGSQFRIDFLPFDFGLGEIAFNVHGTAYIDALDDKSLVADRIDGIIIAPIAYENTESAFTGLHVDDSFCP